MVLDRDRLSSTPVPLGPEDEALLAAVDVSSLDKQEGYDVSLLALQPRDVRPSASSSPPADPRASLPSHDSPPLPDTLGDPTTVYPSGVPSSFSHPSRARDDECAPLDPSSSSRPSSDHRRFRQSAVPALSAPNPRRAARAYSERARATEAHRRGGAALEKGGSAGAGRGRRALWQRKGLLVGLALVVLLVCAGIGIGLGVTLSGSGGGGGEKGDGLEAESAAMATASASTSGVSGAAVAHELQPSMAPTMAPASPPTWVEAEEDDDAAPVPAPTHVSDEAAPASTDGAASSAPMWEGQGSWSDGTEG